ncbi:MAG: transposase, partial [Thermodesulfobacteriota bacterium]
KALQKATGFKSIPSRNRVVPTDSGLGDWLLRMGKGQGIEGMDKVHGEADIKLLKMDKDNEGYTLWADPTIIELGDKAYAEMLYTGQKGDCPILVGLKELPVFVYHKYRKGNAMGGTNEALQSGFEVVEAAGKRIKHTALDSEFYNAKNINFLQGKKNSTFTIVADKDEAVKDVIKQIAKEQWRPYYDIHGAKTNREVAVTVHAMNEAEAFTLVVLRWKKEQMSLFEPEEYFYHAIATNMEVDAEAVIKIHEESVPDSCRAVWQYNERAQMENYLKELKIGVGMEQMPCGEFEANAMYFSIGVLTYNLMIGQEHFVIQEGMQNCTIATLRWKLMHVAAWIAEHGNRVRLKIATTVEKFNYYLRMMKRMEAIAALSY